MEESLYEVARHSRDAKLHKGFNYRGQLFKRSMSNFLFREDKRVGILAKMETIVYECLERVKLIKTFLDFNKEKNQRDFN